MKPTNAEKIIELLEVEVLLTSDEICEKLDISKSALYTAVHGYNKKKTGIKIVSIGSKYRLVKKKSNAPAVADSKSITTQSANSTQGMNLQAGMMKKLKNLSAGDLDDCLDMLKKSEFYKKSAMALIEVNEGVNALRHSLLQGEL